MQRSLTSFNFAIPTEYQSLERLCATNQSLSVPDDRTDLSTNTMLVMALTRCLEILGEAASKISPAVCAKFPAIPFPKIISMRNRLIHAYFDVDLDIVWTTVSDDLPALPSIG